MADRNDAHSPQSPPAALILARADVAGLLRPQDWLAAVEAGFRAAGEGRAWSAMPMHIEGAGGAFHAKGASLDLGRRYVALKLNGNFPDNPKRRGLPTIQGTILLCDGASGSLLAVIDSIEVTLRRTAAATALAARFLARPDSETILVCGCGEQGAAQLAALADLLPLRRVLAWDRDPDRATAFARTHATGRLEIEAVADLVEAARLSDVIVTCTTARTPYLERSFVRPGTFVAAVGADSPEKSELQPELLRNALVVADVLDQCAGMGDLRRALEAGAMRREDVHAELTELVLGRKPGRTGSEQITIFDSTGTALQDVAAAALLFERAQQRGGFATVELGTA